MFLFLFECLLQPSKKPPFRGRLEKRFLLRHELILPLLLLGECSLVRFAVRVRMEGWNAFFFIRSF